MSAPAFEVITENELGVIRLAECNEGEALWNIKSDVRGLVISRDDEHTCISLRVPLALVAVFAQEIAEQRAALHQAAKAARAQHAPHERRIEQMLQRAARLEVLRLLAAAHARTLPEAALKSALRAAGHTLSTDLLRTELDWLREQGFLVVEVPAANGGRWVVRLLQRGEDAVQRGAWLSALGGSAA